MSRLTHDTLDVSRPENLDAIQARVREHLRILAAQGRLRQPASLTSIGRSVHAAAARESVSVNLSSNDYLGLSHAKSLRQKSMEAIERYGTGAGASIIVDSKHDLFLQLQEAMAAFLPLGWQSVFATSGYAANAAFFDLLRFFDDEVEIFVDHRAHASLISGARSSGLPLYFFGHGDWESLQNKLLRSERRYRIVVVESLHSMDGTFASARDLARCCAAKPGTFVYVDEAHSAGLYPGLSWAFEAHNWNHLGPFVMGVMLGCGKALAASGGLLVLPSVLCDLAYQMSRTIMFTTAAPPATVAAVRAAVLELAQTGAQRRNQLQDLLRKFDLRIRSSGILSHHVVMEVDEASPNREMSPIVSVVGFGLQQLRTLHGELLEHGYKTALIRTPTVPKGQERLRLSFSAVSATETDGDFGKKFNDCDGRDWPVALADLLALLVGRLKSAREIL